MMNRNYNRRDSLSYELGGSVLVGIAVGTFFSFLMGTLRPAAGPDWMWAGGRGDPIRALYFRGDGSFRRFGRVALLLTLAAGSASVYWMLSRF